MKIGDTVKVGDVLGYVAMWPSRQNGVRYHHLHLNVARGRPEWFFGDAKLPLPYIDGWKYYNPLDFLQMGNYTNDIKPYQDSDFVYLFHTDLNTD